MFLVLLTLVVLGFMCLTFVFFFMSTMLTVEWNAIGRAEFLIGRTNVTPVAGSRHAKAMCLGFVIGVSQRGHVVVMLFMMIVMFFLVVLVVLFFVDD